jgi:hypothetical protein
MCLLSLCFTGCSRGLGGQVKGESYRSYDKDYAADRKSKKSVSPAVEGARGMSDYSTDDSSSEPAPAPDGETVSQGTIPACEESVIIYEADCSLTVKSVSDSIRAIESLTKGFNARVESVKSSDRYGSAAVVVRVPVAQFDALLKSLTKIGRVTGKNISATNVSDEYRDLSSRLDSAQKVRERLQTLLQKEISVAGRIAILREIDRITTKIASVKARMDYLKGMADLSTVTISLYAERQDTLSGYIVSSFGWIASLSPKSRSIKKAAGIEAETPKGYFVLKKDFEDGSPNLYQSPGDNAALRAGVTDNYPKMDLKFWVAALEDDAANRLYRKAGETLIEGNGCSFAVRSYKVTGETWYALAIAVRADEILVIEDVFTGEKSFAEHYPLFESFLKTVRWK